jgi:putative DNA primase/helicase
MQVEDVLERLEGVTGSNGQWYARCPAHEDRQASLAIAVGRDGRTLLTCWAGCELTAIVSQLRMSVGDLFNGASDAPWGAGSLGQANTDDWLPDPADVERWGETLLSSQTTLDAIFELKGWRPGALAALEVGLKGDRLSIPVRSYEGELVGMLRYWPTAKPKMMALKGHARTPLYVVVDDTGPVWLVEGETDAIAMANLGLNAVGVPGATAKARPEQLRHVRERDVFVCMDNDEPGRKAAVRWAAAALEAGARSVRVVELEGESGYDVGELVLEHRDDHSIARRRLLELGEQAKPYEPPRLVEQLLDKPTAFADEAVDALEAGSIILRPLSSVRARRLRMLWRSRIPVGRVGIIFGPPGQGKSTLLALMTADVTRTGGRVVIASAEDEPATTLLPRMAAAGADIGLVDIISTKATEGETTLVLPRDSQGVHAAMQGRSMFVIDPLSAHLGDDVNSWKEQDVRARVFAPLAHYAGETLCTVPLIMHTNRGNSSDALARISGSGGFGGAARFVMLLGEHPDDIWKPAPDRRLVLVHVKASEGVKQPTMVFERRMTAVQTEDGVSPMPVLELIADDALISPESVLEQTSVEDAGAYGEAIEFLRLELSDGPKLGKRLLATARERGDFSDRTLRRAKKALRVKSVKDSEGWWWELAS